MAQFPEFVEFRNAHLIREHGDGAITPVSSTPEEQSPTEAIDGAISRINLALTDDILDLVRGMSPEFFEKLVLDLLLAMGYGGSREDAADRLGQTGDGGVDGIIREDPLGLDVVCVQAKRWEGTVGRPEVQKFVGSTEGRRSRRGVLITTSEFSREAREFADSIERKVVLIDGQNLARLMIENGVGVTTEATYVIKKVDSDYFEE